MNKPAQPQSPRIEINSRGEIAFLADPTTPNGSSYVAGPSELPLIDSGESNQVNGYTAVFIAYKVMGNDASYRDWISFQPAGMEGEFIHEGEHLRIVKQIKSDRERITVSIEILHKVEVSEIEIEELALSLPVNNDYSPWRFNQRYLYDHKVYEHLYPGGTNGYQLVEKLNGASPVLYCIPLAGTRFEHASRYPGTIDLVRPGIKNHSWPGSSYLFLHAKGYLTRNGFKPLWENQEITSAVLAGGQSASYQIGLGFIPNKEAIREIMLDNREILMAALPALSGPAAMRFELSAVGTGELTLTDHVMVEVYKEESTADGKTWSISFLEAGTHTLRVVNDNGKSAQIVFRITEDLEGLLEIRASFIMGKQVLQQDGHVLNGAILPYTINGFDDMAGEGLYVKEESIWGNGSYEGGITDAIFAAEKNVRFPNERQIRQLEDYIDRYVRRYLQNPETNEVIWWCDGFSTTRAYNYMHVANLYYSMYQIGKLYELTRKASAEYLKLAYETLIKMYEVSRPLDLIAGLMGGQRIFEIMNALGREDWAEPFYTLMMKVRQQGSLLFQGDVPYGSECAYDNTGYECVAYFSHFFNEATCSREIVDVMLAARGNQPVWWWNGSDIRWWDAGVDFAETCHHYTSSLNSTALMLHIRQGTLQPTPAILSAIYGGLLGATAKIHPDGRASMSYCWQQESSNYGDHTCTGDAGLSLFGMLLGLRSFAYLQSDAQNIGFLCEIEGLDSKTVWVITPYQAVGRNVSWYCGWNSKICDLDLNAGFIRQVKISHSNKLQMLIVPMTGLKCGTELTLRLPKRVKQVLVDGLSTRFANVSDKEWRVTLPTEENQREICVEIEMDE